MSIPDAITSPDRSTDSVSSQGRKRRRIQMLAVGAAALLTAGTIVLAFVEKVQDASDFMH